MRSRRGRGSADQRALARPVDRSRPARAEIGQEPRPRVLARPQEDGVRVGRGFVRQRGHVQAAQAHVAAAPPVMIRQLVGPPGRGDVDLDHHQVGRVVQHQGLDVLVLDRDLVVGRQIAGQGRQAERREQRVLDRPKPRAGGLGEGRQDHLDAHCSFSDRTYPVLHGAP